MSVAVSALYLLCLQAATANTVPASSNEYSLHWVTNTTIEIQFPDSTTSTIPLSPPTDVLEPTPCLFTGGLEDEDPLVVVLGCRDSPETNVLVNSKKVSGGQVALKLVDGVTHVVTYDELVTGNSTRNKRETGTVIDHEDYVEMPIRPQTRQGSWERRYTGPLPKSFTLETDMYYDNSLLERFNNNHTSVRQWLSKVYELTKIRMVHPDLIMSVHLKRRKVEHLNDRITASIKDLERLFPRGYKNVGSFFCYDICREWCDVGYAYGSSTCNTRGYGININEFYREDDSELYTAMTWAHELGHNLGMRHDEEHGGPKGPCVGKGLMSNVDGWSRCNNEDFEKYYRNKGYTCHPPPKDCAYMDTYPACSIWASRGYCTHTHENFMTTFCKKSCLCS